MHQEKGNHLTAGTSLACNMLTLIGACSIEQQRVKTVLHGVISGPLCAEHSWRYRIPWRRAFPPENMLIFFPFQNPVFSCQSNLPCLLTPLTHLCFHKHSRLQSGRSLDSFSCCPTQNLMLDPSSHLNFQTELFTVIWTCASIVFWGEGLLCPLAGISRKATAFPSVSPPHDKQIGLSGSLLAGLAAQYGPPSRPTWGLGI